MIKSKFMKMLHILAVGVFSSIGTVMADPAATPKTCVKPDDCWYCKNYCCSPVVKNCNAWAWSGQKVSDIPSLICSNWNNPNCIQGSSYTQKYQAACVRAAKKVALPLSTATKSDINRYVQDVQAAACSVPKAQCKKDCNTLIKK